MTPRTGPRFAADAAVMTRRAVRRTVRGRDTLVVSVLTPVLTMALFVFVFGGAIAVDIPYVAYVVPGIIVLSSGFGASLTATAVATDVRSGSVDRFRTLPMHRAAWLAGHVGEGVLRNGVAVAVVIAVAVAFGFRPHPTLGGTAVAAAVILLYIHAVSWIAVALGLAANSPEAAGGLTYAVMFVPYVSSAFVPTSTMPAWLRGVAEHQPATPVVTTIRSALIGDPTPDAVLAVAWCVVLAIVACALCLALVRRRLTR